MPQQSQQSLLWLKPYFVVSIPLFVIESPWFEPWPCSQLLPLLWQPIWLQLWPGKPLFIVFSWHFSPMIFLLLFTLLWHEIADQSQSSPFTSLSIILNFRSSLSHLFGFDCLCLPSMPL